MHQFTDSISAEMCALAWSYVLVASKTSKSDLNSRPATLSFQWSSKQKSPGAWSGCRPNDAELSKQHFAGSSLFMKATFRLSSYTAKSSLRD
jgi:hypothetical protein